MNIVSVNKTTASTRIALDNLPEMVSDAELLAFAYASGKAPEYHFGTTIRRHDNFADEIATKAASITYWTD